ncbi:hypothetical protein [Salinispora oceanensis]|uniref:hypothetical protein n=1 Tax=Salinispora oceanensis TaxID=1050199 RepID=UPI0013A59B49|nr:hypothetical protein [Salinispora oceanensis]
MNDPLNNRGWGWRGSRRGRSARRAVIAALLVTMFGLTVTARPILESEPERVGGNSPSWTSSDEYCDIWPAREGCSAIFVGNETWRYSLLRSREETAKTVLVDLGGPGISVLSGAMGLKSFAANFSELSSRYNLLFIEEPWVTQAPPAGCEDALVAHFDHLRDQVVSFGGDAPDVAEKCQLAWPPGQQPDQPVAHRGWGFDPEHYSRFVTAISQLERLDLKGFVGHSWGSMRLAYLLQGASRNEFTLDWSVLVRPFPVGVEANVLISEQATVLERNFDAIKAMSPVTVNSRSLPVTYFDQLSALVELGYSDDGYAKENSQAIVQGKGISEIGTLADEYWQRSSRDSFSMGRLAEWQEVCSTTRSPDGSNKKIGDVADLLASRFAACERIPLHTGIEAQTAGKACVVAAPNDSVTPHSLIRGTYHAASPEATWVESAERQHGSFDGLDECLEAVLQP